MTTTPQLPNDVADPAFLAAIVKRVVAQVRSRIDADERESSSALTTDIASQADEIRTDGHVVTTQVVSLDSLSGIAGGTVLVGMSAVITPSAAEEAKQRGITIKRQCASHRPATIDTRVALTKPSEAKNIDLAVTDTCDADRGRSILAQLSRRGITTLGDRRVLLSDKPAGVAIRQTQSGSAAVVLRSQGDADRFTRETDANVFVIDMIDVNLVSAVNIIARLAQGSSTR